MRTTRINAKGTEVHWTRDPRSDNLNHHSLHSSPLNCTASSPQVTTIAHIKISSSRSPQLSPGRCPLPKALSRQGTEEMRPEADNLNAALLPRFRDVDHLPLPIPPVRAKQSEKNTETKCACCWKLNREVSPEPRNH